VGDQQNIAKVRGSSKSPLRESLLETRDKLETFENLVMMGARAVTIKNLMALDFTDKEVRGAVKYVAERMGFERLQHRGKNLGCGSPFFLRKDEDRYHATVILGIAKRIDLVQSVADETYISALIDIYQTYLSTFRTNVHNAHFSFEFTQILLTGWQSGEIGTLGCNSCGSHFVLRPRDLGRGRSKTECPVCTMHKHPQLDLRKLRDTDEVDELPDHVFGVPYTPRFGS
jgi:hypothetical protein